MTEKSSSHNGNGSHPGERVKLRVELEPGLLGKPALAQAIAFEDKPGKTPRLAIRIGETVVNSVHEGQALDAESGKTVKVEPEDITLVPIRRGETLDLISIRAAQGPPQAPEAA